VGGVRDPSAPAAVWLAGLAIAFGGAAGWVVTARFSMWIAVAVVLVAAAAQFFVAVRLLGCWAWAPLPFYVAGGWAASGAGWRGALPLAMLLFGAALGPRVWLDCVGEVSSRTAALCIGAGYLLLGMGVAVGYLPLGSLLALLALPLGARAAVAGVGAHATRADRASRFTAFLVVFVSQVIVGLLITGLAR
jgi:hypothetical protein